MVSRFLLSIQILALALSGLSCAGNEAIRPPLSLFERESLLLHAGICLKAGKVDSASALYARIREEEPRCLLAIVGSGRVALAGRDWRAALDFAGDGLDVDSSSTDCHYIAAIAEREIGSSLMSRNSHWQSSRRHLEWVLARDSCFADILIQYAVLERYNGHWDHALELARAQVAKKPDCVDGYLGLYKLFRCWIATHDSTENLAWLRKQTGTLPRYFVGETLRRTGNLVAAESVFAELMKTPGEVSLQALRISRARLQSRMGHKQAAESDYWQGVHELTDDLGAALLFDDLKYVVTDAELAYYRSIDSLSTKQDFFRCFWNFRNPTPATKTNPRLQEHIRRFTFAEEHYEYYGFRTWFNNPDNELAFCRAFSLNEEFNDMGLIYLRQGDPDDIARHSHSIFDTAGSLTLDKVDLFADFMNSPEGEDYQSWLYQSTAESPRMIFHFQQHRSANSNWRLTGFPAIRPLLECLTLWDPSYERMVSKSSGTMDRTEREHEARDETRAFVGYALSTDRQTWEKKISTFRFPCCIDAFRAPGGQSLLDISYAIPVGSLAHLLPESVTSVPVEIGISLIDSRSHHAAAELETLTVDLSHKTDGAIVDLIRYTVPPDSYAVSIHMRSLAGDLFGTWKKALRVPDFSRPRLLMSSIQVLRPSPNKGALEIDGVKVFQSPFHTHVRTEPLYVYFHIYNLVPDADGTTSYATECRLVPSGNTEVNAGVVLWSNQKAGTNQVAMEFYKMDVRSVSPGSYVVTIRVTDRKRMETIGETRQIVILK